MPANLRAGPSQHRPQMHRHGDQQPGEQHGVACARANGTRNKVSPGQRSVNPQAWTLSNPLGNPASLYPAEVRALFDASFRADAAVQKSILGFDDNGASFLAGRPQRFAFQAGFGSLYWMEGVVFRLQVITEQQSGFRSRAASQTQSNG